MERRSGRTTAGVLVWTPAPAYPSPSSPEGSDFSWDEELDEDFQSQMDENGIIGLAESQGQQEGGEEEIAEDLLWDVKTPEPEYGPPPALEAISYHLSELLDSEPLSQATGDDCRSAFLQEEHRADEDLSEDWTDDEDGTGSPTIQRHKLNTFPERETALDMTDEDTCEDTQRFMDQTFPVTEEMVSMFGMVKSLDFSHEMTEIPQNIPISGVPERSEQSDCEELKETNEQFLPVSHRSFRNASDPISFPHLSSEEMMNYCDIEEETFPELDIRAESSLSTYQSPTPKAYHTVRSKGEEIKHNITPQASPRSPVMKIRQGKMHQDSTSGEKLERRLHTPNHNLQPPTTFPRKTNPASCDDQVSIPAQCISKASVSPSEHTPPPTPHRSSAMKTSKTSHTDPDDIRKGQLSHPLPDFSKVKPRVRFPKNSGYKPPKSSRPPHDTTSHPDLPVVFKSPAEIVREVLLSSSDGSPGSPSTSGTLKRLHSTVPEEFRCPQQASTLVQQLQEDYNRLLTKYAEAENTIDRLRLKAKVGLCSEPPKPSTAILSGVIQEGSKVITLSFPQAQRAEFSAGSANLTQQKNGSENSRKTVPRPSSVSSVSSGSVTADHLTETLTKQTHRFQLQVDAFEALLKKGKLKPCEQIKGLSTLGQGQESLERAYLDARAQYQMLQQRLGGHVTFDPDRDLEGQIFRSGMRLDEMKEWLEQAEQNHPISESTLTPFPPSDVLSVSLLETEPLPESPLSAVHPEAYVSVEVSSVSGESDADREEEEILPFVLHPLYDKHKHVEKDFSNLMGCYQSFKELPGMLDQAVTLKSRDLLDFGHCVPSGKKSVMARQRHRTINESEMTKPAQQQPAADCVPRSSPSVRSQVCDSMETHPEALCHSSVLPGQQGSEKKMSGSRKTQSSSLTSLAESIEPKTMGLKAKAKTVRAPLLDGVMSPETDSGFMGSESSQLTPAVHSPLQQRAVVSSTPSGSHMKNTERPESAPPSRQPFAVSTSRSQPSPNTPGEHLSMSGGCTGPVRKRGEEERCSSSSLSRSISPLHWPNSAIPPWPSSLTSQSDHGSDHVHFLSGEEKAQDSQYPQPANLQLRSHRSPSFHVPYHHEDHLEDQSSVQLTNHQEAFESLQQEVNRLKERLEGNLRLSEPASPVRAPPSSTENTRNHAHPQTTTTQWFHLRSERRKRQTERERNGEKEKGYSPRPILRQRSASLPRHRPETDLTTDSEEIQSEPRPSTLRHVPMSPMTSRGRRQTRGFERHKEDSASGRSDNSDEMEPSRGPEPTCLHCISDRTGASTRPMRSRSSPRLTQSSCSQCPLCGALRASQTANQVPVSTPRRSEPMRSLQRDRGGMNVTVAPRPTLQEGVPVIPYVPVYPSALYFSSPVKTQAYSQPFNITASPSRDGVRGHRRRSLSLDHQKLSLDSSLTRALTAARNMKEVSHRMAHSLSSGLHCSSFLTTSCTY
ncbi:unnamed protein product [Leuciscus chuanchicus]